MSNLDLTTRQSCVIARRRRAAKASFSTPQAFTDSVIHRWAIFICPSGTIKLNDVIFPGGMIVEESGEVKIYYGAADTVECLATANLEGLLALCTEPRS